MNRIKFDIIHKLYDFIYIELDMTPPDKDPNTPKKTDETTGEKSWETTIEETKEQLAQMYLNFLDQQKGWIIGTVAGFWGNFNPLQKEAIVYLTTDQTVKKEKGISNILFNGLKTLRKNVKKNGVEQISWERVVEYDKTSLAKMKALITQYKNDQAKLQDLMAQIQAGTDPTVVEPIPEKTATAAWATVTGAWAVAVESSEKMSDRRKAVVKNIHAIITQDTKKNIDYQWWGKTKMSDGLDCSGLIDYVVSHAWLDMGWDSRNLFKQFPTSKIELDANKSITNDISNIKEGDVMFWNSVKPWFTWPTHWTPPSVEKDWTSYCIHHIAFIKSINKEKGTVDVVQSSSDWVNEATITVSTMAKNQDELYVAQVDYEKLPTMSQAKLAQLETLPWAATVT